MTIPRGATSRGATRFPAGRHSGPAGPVVAAKAIVRREGSPTRLPSAPRHSPGDADRSGGTRARDTSGTAACQGRTLGGAGERHPARFCLAFSARFPRPTSARPGPLGHGDISSGLLKRRLTCVVDRCDLGRVSPGNRTAQREAWNASDRHRRTRGCYASPRRSRATMRRCATSTATSAAASTRRETSSRRNSRSPGACAAWLRAWAICSSTSTCHRVHVTRPPIRPHERTPLRTVVSNREGVGRHPVQDFATASTLRRPEGR